MDVLPEKNWGDIIGGGLASSLSTGLSNIASYKLRRIMQGEATEPAPQAKLQVANSPIQQQSFQPLQAQQAQISPMQQNPYQVHQQVPTQTQQMLSQLQNFGRNEQGMTDPMSMINQTLSGQTGMQQNPFGPSQGMMPQGPGAQDLRRLGMPVNPSPAWPQMPQQQVAPQQVAQQQQPMMQPQVGQPQTQPAQQIQKPYFNTSTTAGREASANWDKQQQAERKFNQARREYEDTRNKDAVNSLRSNAKTAKENIKRYENIASLAATGNLRGVKTQALMEKLGIPAWFMNTETQLAQAEMAALAQGAAAAFDTSRLTNLDVDLYRRSLVSLKNTPEAIQAISKIRILEEQAPIIKDAAREIVMRENGGYAPIDLEERINNMVDPQLNELAAQAQQILTDAVQQSAISNGGGISMGQEFNALPISSSVPVGIKIQGNNGEIYINGPKGWVTTYKGA